MPKIKIGDFTPNDQPRGFETYDINVMFNEEERTLLVDSNETKLTFTGDAYLFLLKSQREDGYNGIHQVEISMRVSENDFSTVFHGNIFIADCEWDYHKGECDVQIMDSGYNSYIKNNRALKVNYKENKTKNGFDINPFRIPEEFPLGIFTTPDGLVPTTKDADRVEDVLNYLVAYMSDNKLQFKSDYFRNLRDTDDLGYYLIIGRELRSNLFDFEGEISFKELYEDLAGYFNLLMTVETIDGVPTVRIEHVDYFRDSEIVFKSEGVKKISQSFIQDFLYGTVRVGGSEAIVEIAAYGGFEQFPPFNFNKTLYTMSGNANLDNTKDISANTLIVDTSSIVDCIYQNNEAYDSKFFLISHNSSDGSAKTPASDIFQSGDFFYNGELTNQAILNRYVFQGGVNKTVGEAQGNISALRGFDTLFATTGTPFDPPTVIDGEFDSVVLDANNLWNTSTNRYTAKQKRVVNFELTLIHRVSPNINFPGRVSGSSFVGDGAYCYFITPIYYKNGVVIPNNSNQNSSLGDRSRRAFYPTEGKVYRNKSSFQVLLDVNDYLEVKYEIRFAIVKKSYFFDLDVGYNQLENGLVWENVARDMSEVDFPIGVGSGDISFLLDNGSFIESKTDAEIVELADSSGVSDRFFVNRFEYEDTLSNKEIVDFLKAPQKAIHLVNDKYGIKAKVWAKNVSINLIDGETKFETFNNIENT
jgi:hypothetical protein